MPKGDLKRDFQTFESEFANQTKALFNYNFEYIWQDFYAMIKSQNFSSVSRLLPRTVVVLSFFFLLFFNSINKAIKTKREKSEFIHTPKMENSEDLNPWPQGLWLHALYHGRKNASLMIKMEQPVHPKYKQIKKF